MTNSLGDKELALLEELGWKKRWLKRDQAKRLKDFRTFEQAKYGLERVSDDDVLVVDANVQSEIVLELEHET